MIGNDDDGGKAKVSAHEIRPSSNHPESKSPTDKVLQDGQVIRRVTLPL